MKLFRRGPKLPADRRPPLAPEERVLAWARLDGDLDGGEVLVATNFGLFLPGPRQRLGWHEIHKATWADRALTLVPARLVERREEYDVVADLPPVSFPLLDPDELPEQVRARVTRSVAYSTRHPLPLPGHLAGGVRVVARRVPGVDGLSWAVRYDPGVDPDHPAVVEATTRLVTAARADG